MQNTKKLQTAAASKGADANKVSSLCPKLASPLPPPSLFAKFFTHSSPVFCSNSKTAIKSVCLMLESQGLRWYQVH